MAQGFFNLGPMPKVEPMKKAPKRAGCDYCGRDRKGRDEPFYGDCREGVLILGEAPRDNSELGGAFLSERALPLWNLEGSRGFSGDILRDCSLGFAVACSIGDDKLDATSAQSCKGRLLAHIKQVNPKVIIAMGPAAIQALIWDRLAGRISNTQPSDFMGCYIPDRELGCWIVPTFGLDYLHAQSQYNQPDRVPLMYFQQHLRAAWFHRNQPLPELPKITQITRDPDQAVVWIRQALAEAREVGIDYETTGLKPHREGHRIRIASMAWLRPDGTSVAYGFQWHPGHQGLIDAWQQLMQSETIGKIAHKADFEWIWTRFRSGLNNGRAPWPKNLSWDTCLGAHCLNNNGKVGLKFLTYVKWGILGYDAHVARYLEAKPGQEDKYGNNAFNYLVDERLPWDDLIGYCAEDSLYSLGLRYDQDDEMERSQRIGFQFFKQGVQTLAKVQSNGLPVSMEKADEAKQLIHSRIVEATQAVEACSEVKQWTKGKFNPRSNPHIVELLFDICKIPPPNGNRNAQETTLSKIKSDFTKALLNLKRWVKMQEFLDGFIRETTWDELSGLWVIRPNFNLSSGSDDDGGGPRTFRSSSDSPNFQNIPKRDKEALKILRSIFVAPPGYKFKEYDYKGVEVSGSACYHQDPQMITYLTDETTDMHRDTAIDMFFRDLKTFTTQERQLAKNGYVFPTFYGATPKSMAPNMWDDMPEATRQHLAEHGRVTYWDREKRVEVTVKGIKTLAHFSEHVKNVDRKFWQERFKVYNQWRKEEWERYQRDGYVETFTGFRCYGPMGFTEATNRRIQGTSFHILLQSLIWNHTQMEEEGLGSYWVGQIHDAQIGLIREEEEAQIDEIVRQNGCVRVRAQWDWIIVPLTIEHDGSPLGGSWATMEPCGKLTEHSVQ